MSITIGIRIEFYDDEGDLAGSATFENGYRACAVPRPGDQVSITGLIKADPWEIGQWWPGTVLFERVHHVDHYPVLGGEEKEPGVIVVIHTAVPGDVKAPALIRALHAVGYKHMSARDDDSALGRAVRAVRAAHRAERAREAGA